MSTSPIQRLLRPAILLAAGILLGQGALAVAAPSAPAATTQTRIASCSGFDFHPVDSQTEFRWEDRVKYRTTRLGDGWFMCNADLPHRAVVSKVRFTLKDDNDRVDLQYCGLARTPLTVAGSIEALGIALSGSGMGAKPGIRRYGTSSIQNAVVDNGAFAYFLQCHIVFDPSLAFVRGPDAGIIGADVTYRISAANG